MKKLLRSFALGVFSAAAVVGCSKIDISIERVGDEPTVEPGGNHQKMNHYTFEVNESGTRAVLEQEGVFWEENDAVGMYLNGSHTEANINVNTYPKTIFLNTSAQIPAGSEGYAYYPYDERNTSADATIVSIPREQVGGAASSMPMVGIPFAVQSGDTNGEVFFLNLGALIDFRVFSSSHTDETVRYIILQDNAGTVSGDGIIDLTAVNPYDESTLAYDSWGEEHWNYVTVRREVAVASSKNGATSILMVVAPGAYASGTITVGTDKAVYTFNYSNKPLARNELKHYNMNLDSANAVRKSIKTLPYSETFASNSVDFTTDGVTIDSNTAVWQYNTTDQAMKATAYKSGAYATVSWLTSPWVDLTGVSSASVSFDQYYNYETAPQDRLTLWVLTDEAGADWVQLPLTTYTKESWVGSGEILLNEYVNRFVRIGFRYESTSTKSQCATWKIKNFLIKENPPSFTLYSGEVTEGDYIIYYDGGALKNTVTSSRLDYLEVTPVNDEISEPDGSIIWHIARSGDYWTIYNAEASKYAGSTSTKNQATLLSSVSDNAKWTITGTSTYEFENLARSTGSDSGNKWLHKNGTYGFACYASSTGGALTLYKRGAGGSSSSSGSQEPLSSGLQYLGCVEVPALELANTSACTDYGNETFGSTQWYAYNTTTLTRRVATHTYSYNNKQYRNYTVMVDQTKRCALWSAYPMHKGGYPNNDIGRVGSFDTKTSYDPAFLKSWQSSGSTSDYNNGAGYARGHLCASEDRQTTTEANKQTFYYTNQCPQIQNGFNSGIWSSLEEAVQNNAPSAVGDTLYVVSGVLFETNNSGASNDGGTVGRPSHFYKLLMRCTFSGGTITAAQGVAYIYTNESHSGANYNNAQFRTTIRAIEQRAGFDFFPSVPSALQASAENSSSSLW